MMGAEKDLKGGRGRPGLGLWVGDSTEAGLETPPVVGHEELLALQRRVAGMAAGKPLRGYLAELGEAVRQHPQVRLGVSPRGLLHWLRMAQAWAALEGRSFVTPDDVQEVALPVLDVRLVLDGLDTATLLEQVFDHVRVAAFCEKPLQIFSVPSQIPTAAFLTYCSLCRIFRVRCAHEARCLRSENEARRCTMAGRSRPPQQAGDSEKVWVVVPAYNEAPRLQETLRLLCSCCVQVVVVDDGSEDDTSGVALRYPVWVLRHVVNCGQGAALQTGIDFALEQGAEVIVTFDADGQHSADEIAQLIEPVQAGKVAVALGSRFLGETVGISWARWLILKVGVLFTRVFSRIRVTDTHNGLRAFSRQAAQQIHITHNRMAHASEILEQIRQQGLSFCEVPVTVHYTEATLAKGQTHWNSVRIVSELLVRRMLR